MTMQLQTVLQAVRFKRLCWFAASMLASAAVHAQDATDAAAASAAASKEKVSYATGVSTVRNFTKNSVPFDFDAMVRGMRDALEGKKLEMSEKEMRAVLQGLQADLRRAMAANHRDLGDKNRKRGQDFLTEFKKKDGVNALPNGVLYRVLKAGDGPKPTENDSVVVNYRGSLIDGTEFDASLEGKPATLRMNQTIMGWREALKQMPVGSKWQIAIPHLLAYGDRGVGETIGPNETLVFEVELVGIK